MKSAEHFLTVLLSQPVIEDPYPLYTALQETGSIAYESSHDVWLVSGYHDCLAILKHVTVFEQLDGREVFLGPKRYRKQTVKDAPNVIQQNESALKESAGSTNAAPPARISSSAPTSTAQPDHTPLQVLVYQALAVKQRSAGIEAVIRQRAQALVDSFKDARTVECVNQLALPLPLLVLSDLFGLEWQEWVQFFLDWICRIRPGVRLSRKLIGYGPSNMSKMGFEHYLTIALKERLQHPHEDVLTALAHSSYQKQGITQTELVQMIERMCAYAVLTTADLIGNALWLILRHPDTGRAIATNPALLPNMLHEALRVESPVQGLFRQATREFQLPTGHIPAGARLLVLLAAANRDANQFPHPEQFAIERQNARCHLGFSYGANACTGSPLALLIASVAIETLLTQFPHINLVEDQTITHHPNRFNRGLRALHVRLDC